MRTYSLVKQTDELKKLIAEHPDYLIAVLAGENANIGDYKWMHCSEINFSVDEILDTDFYDYNDCIFTDRDALKDYLEDKFYDENLSDEELDKAVEAKLEELEPYWKKVICIWADN